MEALSSKIIKIFDTQYIKHKPANETICVLEKKHGIPSPSPAWDGQPNEAIA